MINISTAKSRIVDTNATETADGSKHKECTVCGHITVMESIPKTGGDINYDNKITIGANGSWTGGTERLSNYCGFGLYQVFWRQGGRSADRQ